jgi:hypothetical protein
MHIPDMIFKNRLQEFVLLFQGAMSLNHRMLLSAPRLALAGSSPCVQALLHHKITVLLSVGLVKFFISAIRNGSARAINFP